MPDDANQATGWRRSRWGVELRHVVSTEVSAGRCGDFTTLTIREGGKVPICLTMPNEMADVLAAQLRGEDGDVR